MFTSNPIRSMVVGAVAATAALGATTTARSFAAAPQGNARTASVTPAAVMTQLTLTKLATKPNATPANGSMLGGFTSQRWPIVADVAKNGRTINRIALGLHMSCTSGGGFGTPDGVFQVPISSSGRIHAAYLIAASPGSTTSITGGSDSLTGRLNRKLGTLTGTWHLHLDFQNSDGTTDHCDSGQVSFKARL